MLHRYVEERVLQAGLTVTPRPCIAVHHHDNRYLSRASSPAFTLQEQEPAASHNEYHLRSMPASGGTPAQPGGPGRDLA